MKDFNAHKIVALVLLNVFLFSLTTSLFALDVRQGERITNKFCDQSSSYNTVHNYQLFLTNAIVEGESLNSSESSEKSDDNKLSSILYKMYSENLLSNLESSLTSTAYQVSERLNQSGQHRPLFMLFNRFKYHL